VNKVLDFVKTEKYRPEEINDYLKGAGTNEIKESQKLERLILRPQVKLVELIKRSIRGNELISSLGKRVFEMIESAEIKMKYNGYIEREKDVAEKIKRMNELKIPDDIDFAELKSISTEGRQKLSRIRPETIGMASRISGVSPADISVLLIYLGK